MAVLVVAFVVMYAVKATKTLRVSEAGELEGIDIHEHGTPAYHPEFAFMSITLPAGSDGRVPEDPHTPHEGHAGGAISAAITE